MSTDAWTFTVRIGPRPVKRFSWAEFNALPMTRRTCDIHCVTTWSKLDTTWDGVLVDDLLVAAGLVANAEGSVEVGIAEGARPSAPTPFVLAHSFDGYSANVPLDDLVNAQAMIALRYNDAPITAEHGGPARLLVPHLYFWKSAKWVNGLQFTTRDEAGFWELRGYHMRGDPWREQRFTND